MCILFTKPFIFHVVRIIFFSNMLLDFTRCFRFISRAISIFCHVAFPTATVILIFRIFALPAGAFESGAVSRWQPTNVSNLLWRTHGIGSEAGGRPILIVDVARAQAAVRGRSIRAQENGAPHHAAVLILTWFISLLTDRLGSEAGGCPILLINIALAQAAVRVHSIRAHDSGAHEKGAIVPKFLAGIFIIGWWLIIGLPQAICPGAFIGYYVTTHFSTCLPGSPGFPAAAAILISRAC